ncbi:MAG: hypothetical protein Q8P50_08370 [Bacillota bacterium]|nr:hypothetical protein [Bacillota bacterium]
MMIRKDLPVWLGFVGGAVVIFDYFFKNSTVALLSREFLNWRIVLAAFALALGVGNLTRIHGRAVASRKQYWAYSCLLLATLYGYLALGLVASTTSKAYLFFWDNLYQPLGGTWYSITVFYMASSAWRAFRMRNVEAAVLLGAAMLAMLGAVGIGGAISPSIPVFAKWLADVPQAAALRGITIGAALGMIAVSLRVILGLERTHLGGAGE